MRIELTEKPKNPILIEGVPGIGLVGTIATEFLIEHLGAKQIGKIWSDEIPPVVAIHQNKVVQPLGIYYDSKTNLVILHAVSGMQSIEWKMADIIVDLAKQLGVREMISIESVGNPAATGKPQTFYWTNSRLAEKKFQAAKMQPLSEGIIMGVTGALLLKMEKNLSCIFAETHSSLPDSKAAAAIITVLDKYLGLSLDPAPLMKQAEKMEEKLKNMMAKQAETETLKDKKQLGYIG